MKTTERFDQAVTKLYNAFHSGDLRGWNCKKCAVGSIVGGDEWGSITLQFIDPTDEADIKNVLACGYSAKELRSIERVFLFGEKIHAPRKRYSNHSIKSDENKEDQFKGLCAVVEYLCELDGIPNILDYQKLFEYDKQLNPIHEL